MEEESKSLQYTPTWVVAAVCFVIVVASIFAQRVLHELGKVCYIFLVVSFTLQLEIPDFWWLVFGLEIQFLRNTKQDALFEALTKLKEELMVLGFISLLLTVTQNSISRICIPPHLATTMLPCKRETGSSNHEKIYNRAINRRQLLSASDSAEKCAREGQVPLVSVEALHQLHIFIFVLAVVHVIFCASTMILGGARIRQWKKWEDSIRHPSRTVPDLAKQHHENLFYLQFIKKHEKGYWRRSAVLSWLTHCPQVINFDFHKYMMRTLQIDFKRIVTISYTDTFEGFIWHVLRNAMILDASLTLSSWVEWQLLLLVGAKLEHIITSLGHRVTQKTPVVVEEARVQPSDEHFWLESPAIILDLIHNKSAFAVLISLLPPLPEHIRIQFMHHGKIGLPCATAYYGMGTKFRKGMFGEDVYSALEGWAGRSARTWRDPSDHHGAQTDKLATESSHSAGQEMVVIDGSTGTITELSPVTQAPAS
ncbi:unnamed protein product [Dovyalis caffra]|uniref:MLO-like protein n=1 Tax=Dovyalis caffra TaxID=77055 RepID=A0AAV1RHH7_9ROSI|nr:unnamed protein product [Dovyalis caffra]